MGGQISWRLPSTRRAIGRCWVSSNGSSQSCRSPLCCRQCSISWVLGVVMPLINVTGLYSPRYLPSSSTNLFLLLHYAAVGLAVLAVSGWQLQGSSIFRQCETRTVHMRSGHPDLDLGEGCLLVR